MCANGVVIKKINLRRKGLTLLQKYLRTLLRRDEGAQDGKGDAAARALRLFGHRRSAAAHASRRRADRVLDHRQSRSLGYRQADGAAGAAAADRADAATRRAELELA